MNLKSCLLAFTYLLLLVALVGCNAAYYEGDDDDASGDDDDTSGGDDDDTSGGDGTGPMVITMTISNQTGYDWNGYGFSGGSDPVTVAPAVNSIEGLFANSATVVVSDTIENVEYGAQFCLAFRARDTDEDCYDWENHGNCYNTGAQLAVDITVDFSHYEQGGCPAW